MPGKTHLAVAKKAYGMRILPATTCPVVVITQHSSRQIAFFGIEPGPARQNLCCFAFVGVTGIYPARRFKQRANQRPGSMWIFFYPLPARTEYFFRMVGPDFLRRRRGKTDAVVDRPRIPRLADAEATHIANAHVHHHLRRRYHNGANIGERIDVSAGQPVIEPHGMCACGKGVREGIGSGRLRDDPFLQRRRIGNALLQQRCGERDRLTVLIERHQIGHGLRFTGNTQFQAIQQAVQNMSRIQLSRDQFVTHCSPTGLFGRHQRNAVFFIKTFQRGDNQRRAVG